MTRTEAIRVVAVLLAAYPHARIMDQTSSVYEDALVDLDYALVDRAVRALILTEKNFIPTIALIRERAIEYRDGRKRPGGDAWGDVRRAVGRFGRDRGQEALRSFQDAIVARCVDSLGWRELCDSGAGDASWRARFIDLYDELASGDESDRRVVGVLAAPPERRRLSAVPPDDAPRRLEPSHQREKE